MIAPQIDMQMNLLTNWGFGAALSTVLFLIVAAVMIIGICVFDAEALGLNTRRSPPTVAESGVDDGPRGFDTSAARILAQPVASPSPQRHYAKAPAAKASFLLGVFSIAVLITLLLPIVVTVGSSLTASNYIAFPPRGWSLRWYSTVLDDPSWIDAALLSVEAAGLSALLAVVLGTVAALCFVRGRFFGGQAIYVLLLAPMIVPTIVTAVGVYFLFIEIGLLGSLWSFVFAYAAQTIPIVMLVATSALRRVSLPLERSAMILGASPLRAFFSVTMPAIWPSLAAAGLFAFIHAFDDVVIAEFIAGTTSETLPKKMWVSLVYSIDPTISVVSTIFLAVSLTLLTAISMAQMAGRRQAKPA
jgi:ABC-type spermidine/putrescine transport system permease subunit II